MEAEEEKLLAKYLGAVQNESYRKQLVGLKTERDLVRGTD